MSQNTFTQVFVIHRFLTKESVTIVHSFLSLLDESEKESINKLQQHGIKNYMSQHFNQLTDTQIINDAFNHIISSFAIQYHAIISYDKRSYYTQENTTSFYYYRLLFKQNNLIHDIFQYLGHCGIKSLINCSLVDSIWLLNAFDPKCMEYMRYHMEKLIENNVYNVNRIWQRLRNIRHFSLSAYFLETALDASFVNGLKSMRMERFETVVIFGNTIAFNQDVTKIFCDRLSRNYVMYYCDICIVTGDPDNDDGSDSMNINVNNSSDSLKLPKLRLINCQHAEFSCPWPIVLQISQVMQRFGCSHSNDCIIDLENSDLSGIETLILCDTHFKTIQENENMTKLSRQLVNIKNMKFSELTHDSITLWKGINNHLIKNNGLVELVLYDIVQEEEKYGILRLINDNSLKIDKLFIMSIDNITGLTLLKESILANSEIVHHVAGLNLEFIELHDMIISRFINDLCASPSLVPLFKIKKLKSICIHIRLLGSDIMPIMSILHHFSLQSEKSKYNLTDSSIKFATVCRSQRDIQAINRYLNEENGLYTQFKMLFDHLQELVLKSIAIDIRAALTIFINDEQKMQQLKTLFQRIENDLFNPFRDQLMIAQDIQETQEIIDKHRSKKNGEHLRVPSFDIPTRSKFSVSRMRQKTPIFRFSTQIRSAQKIVILFNACNFY